ncbi:FtsX-like permease family protein [Enorma sp.]|uniref:FtsX-like permease family protein n=1 Tax=Enorma sp. TaxID=1920692 RepID=UPI003AB5B8F1
MAQRRHALWLDIRRSIRHSMGRFLSIVGLMALGSFALVGLFVTGPDMRATGRAYFDALDAADILVIGDFGLNDEDCALIEQANGIDEVEYGYLKDAVVDGTTESYRIQSLPERASRYEVVEGRLPQAPDEIALDSFSQGEYAIGDTVTFDEKPDAQGDTVLTRDTFTVVGFVSSSEIISGVNMGASTAGSGELSGYAVVIPETFDSKVYMTARLTFEDTRGVDPYADEYADLVHAHRDDLEDLLAGQPGVRLAALRAENQATIDDGQAEVDAGYAELADAEAELSDARSQLDEGAAQIAVNEQQLEEETASARAAIEDGAAQLMAGEAQLAAAQAQIEDNGQTLVAAQAQIEEKAAELDAAKEAYAEGRAAYEDGAAMLDKLAAGKEQLDQYLPILQSGVPLNIKPAQALALFDEIAGGYLDMEAPVEGSPLYEGYTAVMSSASSLRLELETLASEQPDEDVTAFLAERLGAFSQVLDQVQQDWTAALSDASAQLEEAGKQIADGEAALESARAEVDAGAAQLDEARVQYEAARQELETKHAELEAGRNELAATTASAEAQIAAAKEELAAREAEYQEGLEAYNEQKPEAEERLAQAKADLAEAQEKLDRLEAPGYSVSSRREVPGGDGYKIYATVAQIVDALAWVFPILLYFIAALVTFTTMTRMVDEERIGAGTLKALGYSDWDVALKFVVYGFVSSMIGTVLGIVAGHTLLPWIVYSAYATKFVLPPIHLLFDPAVSVVAVVLGLVSAVLPAWLAVRSELRDKPSELLLPKPPASGSKILLERIPFIWNRLSFTHKVTARNLFRYKKRMFMTVFGVAGAVVLLVAGFGTQYSISGISAEQFGNIVTYDMIVAQVPTATDAELAELESELAGSDVERTLSVHYEALTKVAGVNGDTQDIVLIVPDDPAELEDYIDLRERVGGEDVPLDAGSCVLSERLAQLLGVGAGDSFTVSDATGEERELTCTGVTEMYMGHFIFMGEDAYEEAFGEAYAPNAALVTLADSSAVSVNALAAHLMELPAARGIVQNTSLMAQIATIVESLNKIMVVLIVVATLLAGVILYNLTTINISERIRELSTIKVLGFFDGEVTMYIYRETMLLTALGILVGYVLGMWFRNYIITVVPPDNVMFDPTFAPYVFIIPLVIVGTITALLGVVVNRRLRDVDMLEALKSVE